MERATDVGVDVSDEERVTSSHLGYLGSRNVQAFSNPVYTEFLKLIRDARYTIKDSKEVGKRLENLHDENDRLKLLAEERAARGDVISGTASKPSPASRLRQSLGFALANSAAPGNMVELNPETRSMHRRMLVEALEVLQATLTQQEHLG
jgi:hypothetical protein